MPGESLTTKPQKNLFKATVMHSPREHYWQQSKDERHKTRLPSMSTLLQYIGIEPQIAHENSYYVNNIDDRVQVENKRRLSQSFEEQPMKKTKFDQHIHKPSHSEGCAYPNIHNIQPEEFSTASDIEFDEGTERIFVCENPSCQRTFARRSDLKTHERIHSGER